MREITHTTFIEIDKILRSIADRRHEVSKIRFSEGLDRGRLDAVTQVLMRIECDVNSAHDKIAGALFILRDEKEASNGIN